jgi:endonuclease/exonuclease/phosphatase family metal-dependent hydrolase
MARRASAALDRAIVIVSLIVLGLAWIRIQERRAPANRATNTAAATGSYLFCTWNVENFYDDVDDPRFADAEEDWFGRHPEIVQEKVRLLADSLARQNAGQGPDIIAMVEVESRRSVELLRDALNNRLSPDRQYTGIAFQENHTGRHNAPAILTRLRIDDRKTRSFGIRRILEVHLGDDDAPLIILISHWTSRLRGDTVSKRDAYADVLYERVEELCLRNPAADVLLSGDFNDEPDDPSLRDHLHTTADSTWVRPGANPVLLDLMGQHDASRDGTYFASGRWEILDHIVVSAGLLDPAGWHVVADSLEVVHPIGLRAGKSRRPQRFGSANNPNPRGPSDHFAVSVTVVRGTEN